MTRTGQITGVLERAGRIILTVAAALAAVIAVAALVALCAGIRPVIFLSGSMAPHITTGALALTEPVDAAQIRTGDIISVERQDQSRVTHRVVKIQHDHGRVKLLMQGDANNAPDADIYDVTDGADRLIWHANGLGRFVSGVKSPVVIACAGALLIIALWPSRRSEPEHHEELHASANPSPSDQPPLEGETS